jgi:Pretoxin HINT domain
MRSEAFSRPLLATIFCAAFFGSCSRGSAAEAPPANPQASALVKQALEAEAQGKMDQRDALAKQALQVASGLPEAHWIVGQVQQGGKWVSIEDAAAEAAKNGKLDEYRQRRDALLQKVEAQRAMKVTSSAEDQLELARWCEKAGLQKEQRFHLIAALQIDPKRAETRKKLGLVAYRGTLMPADQVDEFDARLKNEQKRFAQWKDRLQALRKQIEDGQDVDQAFAQIRAIRDVSAIPALEAVFGNSKPNIGAVVVVALAAMPEQQATESLARFAVDFDSPAVREQAAYALRSRSMFAYVPVLLAGLRSPNFVNLETFPLVTGGFGYQMSVFREGMFSNTMLTSGRWAVPATPPIPVGSGKKIIGAPNPNNARIVALNAEFARNGAARLASENADISARNRRISSALHIASGEDRKDDALDWWRWWYQFNEYYETDDVPTEYVSEAPVLPTPLFVRTVSCFVAGTPVWTQSGLRQIQMIKPGDCVLSQNVETGELALKPVLGTTTRPPSSLINIQIGENLIRSTRGHPFWVSGAGWKMAKELKAGDWLHAPRGAVPIDNVEEKDEDVCYNLVVADFDNYFIGKDKVLVHDNNLRVPTDAIVPGLLRQ